MSPRESAVVTLGRGAQLAERTWDLRLVAFEVGEAALVAFDNGEQPVKVVGETGDALLAGLLHTAEYLNGLCECLVAGSDAFEGRLDPVEAVAVAGHCG
jgi:hypothetical protein